MAKLDFDLERDVPQLTGKVILITGGTNGLGAAAATMLASRNPAKIYITGRNESSARRVIDDIKSKGSSTEIVWLRCDHTDLATVKDAAEVISAKESRLDVLMANAGIMALPPGLTKDRYELHFGINHVAHALIIRKLLPLLQKTVKEHGEARIIPISSLALVLAPRGYGIVFDDLKTTQAYWILGKWQRYAQSKLANLLYGRELTRRYPEILTLIVDPGPSNTGLVSSLGFLDKMIVYLGNINKFLEDDQGHLNQVWAVGVPKDRAKQGEFYEPVGIPTQGYTHWCLDQKLAERLWDWTEEELKPWMT
ncbi:NAD(P)-binding protein [Annulohypoxylon truncatum]|uniref:NAD(P)-binding protein n=1 Tax=Annulohypoxylon truncatum TaxID=327061 RepID=UPI0020082E08|nr:NAD(P)-binding protein [Annulohypoxylon truncatum]KAI1206782.1 NAD(P)-binding protein [Annulohypoxylon truncatum]